MRLRISFYMPYASSRVNRQRRKGFVVCALRAWPVYASVCPWRQVRAPWGRMRAPRSNCVTSRHPHHRRRRRGRRRHQQEAAVINTVSHGGGSAVSLERPSGGPDLHPCAALPRPPFARPSSRPWHAPGPPPLCRPSDATLGRRHS